jgi:CheY-like chemotaxis protein
MSRATILIAEDESDIRAIVKCALIDLDLHIIEAANGYDAIQFARQRRPDVILLDLCMPGLDGWEIASRIRSDPALEDVPIIVMTAYYTASTVLSLRSAGCQHIVAKPFDLDDITSRVAALAWPAKVPSARYA